MWGICSGSFAGLDRYLGAQRRRCDSRLRLNPSELRNKLKILYNLADAGNPDEGVVDCPFDRIPNGVRVPHR